jgi:hypothetical protein
MLGQAKSTLRVAEVMDARRIIIANLEWGSSSQYRNVVG